LDCWYTLLLSHALCCVMQWKKLAGSAIGLFVAFRPQLQPPRAGSTSSAKLAARATPCCWSKHKQQSIFAILTVFIAPMITYSMDLGSPSLSSQLLICSLLLHQINWFTREIDWKDWCTNLGWWGMNQTCSAWHMSDRFINIEFANAFFPPCI